MQIEKLLDIGLLVEHNSKSCSRVNYLAIFCIFQIASGVFTPISMSILKLHVGIWRL
jgi:hypothetical protein